MLEVTFFKWHIQMYGSAHKTTFHSSEASVRLRTQWGGWGPWLGAGEGLAKAREELTRAKPSRTIHLRTALCGLSSSNSSKVNNLHQQYLIFGLKVVISQLGQQATKTLTMTMTVCDCRSDILDG